MKKLIIILISLISFISCEKEYPTFNNTQTEETNSLDSFNLAYYKFVNVYDITIKPSDWMEFGKVGDENCYVFVEVDCPLITYNVINYGVVLVYYVDENDRDNILPYIQSYLPKAPSADMVIETFCYDAKVGKITFKIQNSDHSFHELSDIQFKIVVAY